MSTGATLINDTLRHCFAGEREARNQLSGAYTAGGTSLTFTYGLGQIREGTRIAIEQELFYVWSTDDTAKTATVTGADGGSTAANHASASQVFVNPRFPRFICLQALNDELLELSSPLRGLFKVSYVDLTYNSSVLGFNLTSVTAVEDILEVRAKRLGSDKRWDMVPYDKYELQRNASTSDFASGFALMLGDGDPGQTVRVIYKAPFGALADETTDPNGATVGFPSTANDILSLGAAIRLVWPREIPRNFIENQGDTRRPNEVPSGAIANSVRGLVQLYEQRVAQEQVRQQRQYPTWRYG